MDAGRGPAAEQTQSAAHTGSTLDTESIVDTGSIVDTELIRGLVLRWAAAVHDGDLDAVLADHAEDIVMFDVPPPYQGVRGIEAYRETWPPFFEWQRQGACFEIESLDIAVGDQVAYAYALVRCGTPEELAAQPQLRLRLSLGLLERDGRWVVGHEHHSFPSVSTP